MSETGDVIFKNAENADSGNYRKTSLTLFLKIPWKKMFCEHLGKRVMITWSQHGLPKDKSWKTHHVCVRFGGWISALISARHLTRCLMTFLPSGFLGATCTALGIHGDASGVARKHLLRRRQTSCHREAGPLVPPPTWTRATLLLSVFISLFWSRFYLNKVLLLRNNLETVILDDKMQTLKPCVIR